jgi:hypothetical protein
MHAVDVQSNPGWDAAFSAVRGVDDHDACLSESYLVEVGLHLFEGQAPNVRELDTTIFYLRVAVNLSR